MRMPLTLLALCLGSLSPGLPALDLPASAAETQDVVQVVSPSSDRVLTHREQAPLVEAWIHRRFDTLLP